MPSIGQQATAPVLIDSAPGFDESPKSVRSAVSLKLIVAGCVVIAAASLVLAATPTFDPMAWVTWGREVAHLDLATAGDGPSWKPLPIFFTTIFSFFGDAAPALWLIVARAGGLLAVVLAYRLSTRIAGRTAGVVAAIALLLSTDFLGYLIPYGLTEPLCAALALLALERHLDRHFDQALLALFGASLLRPEAWPFLGVYAAYRMWTERERWPLVAGLAIALLTAWFLPDYLSSGDWLRSAHRATNPTHGGALIDRHPALAVLRNTGIYLTIVPLRACALAAVIVAVARPRGHRSGKLVPVLALITLLWVAIEASMTQLHTSAGDTRYLIVAGAFGSVLAGVGWVWIVGGVVSLTVRRWTTSRAIRNATAGATVTLIAASAPFAVSALTDLRIQHRAVAHDVALWNSLPVVIRRAGGRQAIVACGQVGSEPFWIPTVAWRLGVHLNDVMVGAIAPGTLFRNHLFGSAPLDPPEGGGYTRIASAGRGSHAWVLSAQCRPGVVLHTVAALGGAVAGDPRAGAVVASRP